MSQNDTEPTSLNCNNFYLSYTVDIIFFTVVHVIKLLYSCKMFQTLPKRSETTLLFSRVYSMKLDIVTLIIKIFLVIHIQGVPKKCTNRTNSLPKLSAMGLNFTIEMTWGRLILLSLSKKRPKDQSQDTRGAGKWLFSQCTVAPL